MRVKKDPDALIDVQLDWSKWLAGDTILTSSWILPATTDGFAIDNSTSSPTTATVWVKGGAHNNTHEIVNRIRTANGRINDQTVIFTVENR